jgi:hypothetical protein
MQDETGYHATMVCTKALALRQGLKKVWNLPPEPVLAQSGNDWVLVLLDRLDHDMRCKMMFLWWRAWHHRNNIIFDDGLASVQNSISFLQNYLTTTQSLNAGCGSVDRKGKGSVFPNQDTRKESLVSSDNKVKYWEKPQEGWVKCNVDTSFLSDTNNG